jgi:hypothetical protein
MSQLPLVTQYNSGATFDAERRHRVRLWRYWAPGPRVLWVMLNPSTADEDVLDPTVRRCVGFSRRWGFGGLYVGNLFTRVSSDPRALRTAAGRIGAQQLTDDWELRAMAHASTQVIVAWGQDAAVKSAGGSLRAREVTSLLADYMPLCLGITKAGHPRHPLYVPYKAVRVPYIRADHSHRP